MLKVLFLVVPRVRRGVADVVQGQVVVDADIVYQEFTVSVAEGGLNRILVVVNKLQVARGKVVGKVDLGGLECENGRRRSRVPLAVATWFRYPDIRGITSRSALCSSDRVRGKGRSKNNDKP